MNLVEITESILIDPNEVSSIQREVIIRSIGWSGRTVTGSVITLKNGRKIFVKNKTPGDILKIIETKVAGR